MTRNAIIDVLICIIIIVLLVFYSIYVIVDERKKVKYYNKIINYDSNWDKYQTMLERQKRIIIKKKLELYGLRILVIVRRIFK